MKKEIVVLAIGLLLIGLTTLYAQGPREPKLVVEGETHLATEGGYVGIGTTEPGANLHIKETAPEHRNYPRILMEDLGSGDKFLLELDTEPWGRTTQFYFPCTQEEPNWGMFMRIDADQHIWTYSDLYVTDGGEAGRGNLGVGTSSPQSPAPDETTTGLIDAHDVYVRAADSGSGKWVSEISDMHMAKMVRSSTQNIPDGGTHKINLNREIFDVGGIANSGNGRFTIKQDGIYLVTTSWRCGQFLHSHQQAEDSELSVYIFLNGSSEALHAGAFVKGPVNETGYVVGSDILSLREGDYLDMRVRHTAGGARNTLTGVGDRPRMSVIQLR